jgi:sugar phosphate isomerase/epimerase
VAGSAAMFGTAALSRFPHDVFAAPPAEKIQRIGLELYTVRTEMRRDVAATLKRVAEVGYKEVEFAGYMDTPPERLRALLDQNGLTSPSVHTAIELLEREFATHAAAAKTLGHRWLIVPSLSTRQLTTASSWKEIATRFNELGKKARDAGLRFAFHNHAVEPAPIADGSIPFDILLTETDPAIVDFQMDLYWMIKAGGDPLAYFAKHPRRFTSVHVKDGTPTPILSKGGTGTKQQMDQRDVGAGMIDWAKIFEKRAQAGIAHYYVEHDEPGTDPFASVKYSYEYLSKLEFK